MYVHNDLIRKINQRRKHVVEIGVLTLVKTRCMTARDRLRAWDVIFLGSSYLPHKSRGIFVASRGFAHCIGTRQVFHNVFIST